MSASSPAPSSPLHSHVYLSYSFRNGFDQALLLHEALVTRGARVFFNGPHDGGAGHPDYERSLQDTEVFALMATPGAFASQNVRREIAAARARAGGRRIVCVWPAGAHPDEELAASNALLAPAERVDVAPAARVDVYYEPTGGLVDAAAAVLAEVRATAGGRPLGEERPPSH